MDGETGARLRAGDLEADLRDAHHPTLVLCLVHLTGDASWLDRERPVYEPFGDDQGGLTEGFREEVRRAAAAALRRLAEGAPLPPPPPPALVRRMMDWIAGAEIPERYAPFLLEELDLSGEDARRPDWSNPRLAEAAAALKVTIIGAGMSGLLAAIRLKQAGVAFEIVEKNPDVGGTWLENAYPGVRVDTPNHLYSYSFEPNHGWPQRYSTGEVLRAYFRDVADRHGLRPFIRFSSRVLSCRWSEADQTWTTRVEGPEGRIEEIVSSAVVTAVGQLNQPRLPDFPGQETFRGPSFHSARWPQDFRPEGKRIAVVGTGASAFQFVPEIARTAERVTVFQRSPPWLAPTANYHEAVPEGKKRLIERVPFYDRWYRFFLFWTMTDGVYEAVKADPDWSGGPEAVGAANAELRAALVAALEPQAGGRRDLLDKVVPNYPFGGKRALRDNGVWMEALRRDNVELVVDPIRLVRPEGIETRDGTLRAFDAVIYGTGFAASDFLKGVKIYGRNGRELHDVWDGDARAYLGMLVPGFPNFFMIYGPNTNIVVNGSIIFFSECAVRYILGALELLARTGARSLEVKPEVHDAFNAAVDRANAAMAWGAPQARSWYKNAKGRVSQNWPFPLVDYWRATLSPNPEDLRLEGSPRGRA